MLKTGVLWTYLMVMLSDQKKGKVQSRGSNAGYNAQRQREAVTKGSLHLDILNNSISAGNHGQNVPTPT